MIDRIAKFWLFFSAFVGAAVAIFAWMGFVVWFVTWLAAPMMIGSALVPLIGVVIPLAIAGGVAAAMKPAARKRRRK